MTKIEYMSALPWAGNIEIDRDLKSAKVFFCEDITFDQMAQAAQVFHTRNINVMHEDRGAGCATCGYDGGSSWWLEVREIGSTPEVGK